MQRVVIAAEDNNGDGWDLPLPAAGDSNNDGCSDAAVPSIQ